MKKSKYASIDIGSNTIRLLILEEPLKKEEKILVNQVRTVRLGRNLETEKKIPEERLAAAEKVFHEYNEIIKQHEIITVVSAATESVRKAENKDELLLIFEKVFGFKPEIISGVQEAEVLKEANLEFVKIYGKFLLFDIGGGSTEFITESPKKIKSSSVPIGVLRMLEKYFKGEIRLEEKRYIEIIEEIQNEIRGSLTQVLEDEIPVIGTGGTVTTLICVFKGLKEYNHLKVHHSHIPVEEIEIILDTLNALDLEGRRKLIGVDPDRADILIPGILIVLAVLRLTKQQKLIVSDKGMLFGLIYKYIKENKGVG